MCWSIFYVFHKFQGDSRFLHKIPGYFQGLRSQNKFKAFQGFQGAVGTLLQASDSAGEPGSVIPMWCEYINCATSLGSNHYFQAIEKLLLHSSRVLQALTEVSNNILVNRSVPKFAMSGYKLPFHNRGKDCMDTDNYWGVTITSAFGSLGISINHIHIWQSLGVSGQVLVSKISITSTVLEYLVKY